MTESYHKLPVVDGDLEGFYVDEEEKVFRYFDFYEEFDNKEYETEKYKKKYGDVERTYKNYLLKVSVGIFKNVEYIVAKEVYDQNEIEELKKYCPCIDCYKKEIILDNDINDIFRKYFNCDNFCLNKGKKCLPIIQEARKLKYIDNCN